MSELALVEIINCGAGSVTVRIAGEIDASNVDSIATQLDTVADQATFLTVDLTAISYLDSQGLRIIQSLADRHTRHELDLTLVLEPTNIIYRLLTIVGLDRTVPITGTAPGMAARPAPQPAQTPRSGT